MTPAMSVGFCDGQVSMHWHWEHKHPNTKFTGKNRTEERVMIPLFARHHRNASAGRVEGVGFNVLCIDSLPPAWALDGRTLLMFDNGFLRQVLRGGHMVKHCTGRDEAQ